MLDLANIFKAPQKPTQDNSLFSRKNLFWNHKRNTSSIIHNIHKPTRRTEWKVKTYPSAKVKDLYSTWTLEKPTQNTAEEHS